MANRVLLITEVFPPQHGGSGRWLWEVYRRLEREEVVVAAGEHPAAAEFDRSHDLRLHRLPLRMSEWGVTRPAGIRGYWRALASVRGLVKRYGVEQLHCGRCLPEGWLAWMLKKTWGLPYLCYVHGEELSYGVASRELGWMLRRVQRGAKFLIANSENTARLLNDQWSVPERRIRVMHPGMDGNRFQPAAPSIEARRRLGWDGRRVVLTVGRLQRRKGHDVLIQALPAIRERVPELRYAMVGDGEERGRLEELAVAEGVTDVVQFLGDIDDERLIECYQQCDLFALPNRQVGGDIEGFGMVLVEAQACGKAVVAGRSGGTRETMRVGETGFLVDCETPQPLADTICDLLIKTEQLSRAGEAARRWAMENFDWTVLTRQSRRLFEELNTESSYAQVAPKVVTPEKLAAQ